MGKKVRISHREIKNGELASRRLKSSLATPGWPFLVSCLPGDKVPTHGVLKIGLEVRRGHCLVAVMWLPTIKLAAPDQ